MLRLDKTTTSLKVVLSAAKTTTDAQVICSYFDIMPRGKDDVSDPRGATTHVTTNGITQVTVLAAPTALNRIHNIDYISCSNTDSAAITVIFLLDFNGTTRQLIRKTLAQHESLIYESTGGWQVI